MDFIAEMKGSVKLDIRYENFQKGLRDVTRFDAKDIFMLGVILGYREKRRSDDFEGGGLEFRPTYLSFEDKTILYSMAYDIYGESFFSKIVDEEFHKEFFQILFKYSNGGMEILYEDVFEDTLTEGQFRKNYLDYDSDLLKYMYQSMTKAPF